MPPISRRHDRAFTLLELIVVLTVLGILAAIAIPTFARMVDRSEDEATRSSLAAVLRDAQALHRLDADDDWSEALATAVSEVEATSPGLSADGGWQLADAPDTAVSDHGEVSYSADVDTVEVATLSPVGRAVYASTTAGGSVDACVGDVATLVTADATAPTCEAQLEIGEPAVVATSTFALTGNININEVASGHVSASTSVTDSNGDSYDLAVRISLETDGDWFHELGTSVYNEESDTWSSTNAIDDIRLLDESEFGGGWVIDDDNPYEYVGTTALTPGHWDANAGDALRIDWSGISYSDSPTSLTAVAS